VQFVLDRYEVSYAPSADLLIAIADRGTRRKEGCVLVLADPHYPGEAPDGATAAGKVTDQARLQDWRGPGNRLALERLSSSRNEALVIADLLGLDSAELDRLRVQRDKRVKYDQIDLCLGSEASGDVLRGNLAPYSILHIASHAWFNREGLKETGLILSGMEWQKAFVSAAEATGFHLEANLVVLAACESALGTERPGEGNLSLARAFLIAGSRNVIASLWPIGDLSTAQVMADFYRGAPIQYSSALQHAKQMLRGASLSTLRHVDAVSSEKTGSPLCEGHPAIWAPYVLFGNLR